MTYNAQIPRTEWTDDAIMEGIFKWSERYPNFRPQELACKCCGHLILHYETMDALQRLRTMWQAPMRITSGTRCAKHNERVGGAKGSLHMQGRAFDIHMPQSWTGRHTASFLYYATHAQFRGIGLYRTFIHLDTGPHRTWEEKGNPDPFDRDDVAELE